MTRVSASADGVPNREMADYYTAFARGGFGMVITEGTYTDDRHSQSYLNQPGAVTSAHTTGWARVAGAVQAEGARIVMQLMHAGALSQGNPHRDHTIGPSPVPPRGRMMPEYGGEGPWQTPKEMDDDDIGTVVRGFADAAGNARQAGFDGVEIHAANGYLLDQFLTDYTNQRADHYGGSVLNRVRLTCEVVSAVRSRIGAGPLVGVRVSQTKVNDFEHKWAGGAGDAEQIFAALAKAGADYLHVAGEGRDWHGSARMDSGDTITRIAKRVSGVPVIANGGMHDLAVADQVLEEGHADLVALGRGALANPDLVNRVAAGRNLDAFAPEMLHPMATLGNARRWASAGERH